jgi:hypothetical protein
MSPKSRKEGGGGSPKTLLPIAILLGHHIGMARKGISKLDWAQIKSDALDLPYSPASEPVNLEPKPAERQIPLAKIKSVVTKTKGRTLSETEIKTLDILVNDALLFFFRSRSADASSPKQLAKAYNNFYAAIKTLEKSLPESRNRLFWAISDKGEAFARKMGPHPGLKPYKAGLSTPDEGGMIADKWLIFLSEERLDEFCNLVKQVSSWMTGSFFPPERPTELSPSVWLIGESLPNVYEQIYGKKYGKGESGPGHRFVKAVLEAAAIRTDAGKPFKAGTIKVYRNRAISRLSAS